MEFVCSAGNTLVETTGRTDDGRVEFELDRCMASICAGGCQVFSVYFRLVYDGRTDEAWDAQIDYTLTHHNWDDSLIAALPDRSLRWEVKLVDVESGIANFVAIDALDGSPILEEIAVPSETEFTYIE